MGTGNAKGWALGNHFGKILKSMINYSIAGRERGMKVRFSCWWAYIKEDGCWVCLLLKIEQGNKGKEERERERETPSSL